MFATASCKGSFFKKSAAAANIAAHCFLLLELGVMRGLRALGGGKLLGERGGSPIFHLFENLDLAQLPVVTSLIGHHFAPCIGLHLH